MTQHNVILNV